MALVLRGAATTPGYDPDAIAAIRGGPFMTRVQLTRRRALQWLGLAGLVPFAVFPKDRRMRIFITGSTDGLGRHAAETLLNEGHEVVLHARSKERAAELSDLAPRAAGVVTGDLSSAAQTRS